MNYIGLYYPFIHFKDDAWLKLTALYWDGMARIVPQGYTLRHDSETVKKLAGELGFIENVDPGQAAFEVGARFTNLLEQRGSELAVHYGLKHKDSWPDDPYTGLTAPPGSDPKLAYIFNEKLSNVLQASLLSTNLAMPSRVDDPRWIGMHPKLVSVYMAALADEIARQQGLHPLTDETQDHLMVAGCTVDRLARALLEGVNAPPPDPILEQEIEEQLVRIAIESIFPRDMNAVPVDQIIKLRKEHPGELVNFQECIHGLVHDLQEMEITDRVSVKKQLHHAYKKNVTQKQAELKKALEANNIKTTVSALLVSAAPSSLAASAATTLGIAAPWVAAGGIALGLSKVLLDHRKATLDAMQKSPVAYLVRMEKQLKPKSLLAWVMADTRKFFFGI